ncbi:MAG: CoA pyrophosphatase [Rhodobacter sp.]|nr:CoA pyrophosphatase [Rhodobacter sp.]
MPKRLRVSVIDPGTLSRALAQPLCGSSDFDLNPELRLPPDRVLRPAGVLIAVRCGPTGADLILTKRSSRLKHHPGQIAFPGGKVEPGDGGPVGAALRESREEVGLPQDRVTVLGTLPQHETVTGFLVTPVLGIVSGDFTPLPEAGEVDEVFAVPLAHVTAPENFTIERRRWRGDWRRYYAVPYGPYYIWGATARILRGLADRLSACG